MSSDLNRLLVYQSTWAMERRHPDGYERTLDENLEMILGAGYDGVSVSFEDRDLARRIGAWQKAHGLSAQALGFPRTVEALAPVIENAEEFGANHISIQPNVRPYRVQDCIPYLEGWRRLAEQTSIPVFIETHRDRMTTDLFFTLQLLDCFPDLRLTGDLSHYLVGREFAWPIDDDNHALMHRILDNCWAYHGRVASREQVQVQISFPQHREWFELFLGWWSYGFRSWLGRAAEGDTLTFTCEIGPKEYAMTGPDGNELSDRWEEALLMKRRVKEAWRKVVAEAAGG